MRNKITAALLAFFFGWFGVHKFYLGEGVAGVVYLLFCWTMIPGIIAFFEFFGLLLTSDQVFDARYNGGTSLNPGYNTNNIISHAQESSRDKAAALGELKNLYDNGVITAEEYEGKRRKLLDSI
jgi:TM2 domain-containing membrane protein YozV